MLDINLTLPIMMAMFLLFAVAMNAVFFAPVTAALDARAAHVAAQHERASQAIAEAQGLQADYETRLKAAQVQAHEAIQAAMKEAESRRQAMLDAVRAEISQEVEAARASVRAERDRAIASLGGEVQNFAETVQRKVLGATPTLAGAQSQQGGA